MSPSQRRFSLALCLCMGSKNIKVQTHELLVAVIAPIEIEPSQLAMTQRIACECSPLINK